MCLSFLGPVHTGPDCTGPQLYQSIHQSTVSLSLERKLAFPVPAQSSRNLCFVSPSNLAQGSCLPPVQAGRYPRNLPPNLLLYWKTVNETSPTSFQESSSSPSLTPQAVYERTQEFIRNLLCDILSCLPSFLLLLQPREGTAGGPAHASQRHRAVIPSSRFYRSAVPPRFTQRSRAVKILLTIMPFFTSPTSYRLNAIAGTGVGPSIVARSFSTSLGILRRANEHGSHPALGHLILLVFEAVMEVVCVSLPGYILARRGILDTDKQKFLAELNVALFTPCLSACVSSCCCIVLSTDWF